MAGIFSLLIALCVSLIVNRIAALALMFTGLSREAARFQARSAFSGVGFTTKESEDIVNHPVRRRIVMLLMLMGNIGIATVIATVMISVSSAGDAGLAYQLRMLLILTLGSVGLFAFFSSRTIERQMNRLFAVLLRRLTDLDVRDYQALLQLADGYVVSEMLIEPKSWLAESRLSDLKLSDEGILVLGIHRRGEGYRGIPRGDDALAAGDTVIVYGKLASIKHLDRRRRGAAGDKDHRRQINSQVRQQASEIEHE